jgi:protein SCO1
MRNFVLVLLLLLCLPGCSAKQEAADAAFVGTDIAGAKLGADFDLVDHDAKPRHLSDFRGKLVALFFGYTHCPDVCPTTMADLAKALKLLGPLGGDVQVLFVTLDPERDTAEVLKRYVPSFNPGFMGLRGDKAATDKVAADFKIFFAKQESGSKSGYTIDHSAGVYVFDRKGDLRLYLNHGQSAKDIAHDFGLLLKE